MAYTEEQREQLELQIRHHQHDDYQVDIELTPDFVLRDFSVRKRVLRPEIVAAKFLAQWLVENKDLYQGKKVIDMGCGTGIQGIVMALNGAREVICTDVDPGAVANAAGNVYLQKANAVSRVVLGDLFEEINGWYRFAEDLTDVSDLIVFNHPFFGFGKVEDLLAGRAMNDEGTLLHRFLEEAPDYLTFGSGSIIMPYYHKAGPINDPGVQAPKHGYKVEERLRLDAKTGIQQGEISIYELKPREN